MPGAVCIVATPSGERVAASEGFAGFTLTRRGAEAATTRRLASTDA